MSYTPYIFAINSHVQGIIYSFYDKAHTSFKSLEIKYDRELFKLKDGGTLALDWYNGVPNQ